MNLSKNATTVAMGDTKKSPLELEQGYKDSTIG